MDFQEFKISRWQCKQTKWRCKQTIWRLKKLKLRKWIKIWNKLIYLHFFMLFQKDSVTQFISLYFLARYNHIFFFSKGKIHFTRCTSIYSTNHFPYFSCMFWTFLSYWLCHTKFAPRSLNWFHNLIVYQTQKNQWKTFCEILWDDGSDKFCF